MITDDQLNEWQKICDAATPGPWENRQVSGSRRGCVCVKNSNLWICDVVSDEHDARFIAHSYAAMPLLIEEVRRLNKIIEEQEIFEADMKRWGFTVRPPRK